MKQIHSEQAPAAIGPYSQAIEVNGFVFASGQIPVDPATGNFVEGGVKEQTRQCLTNAKHVLEAAGTDFAFSQAMKTGAAMAAICIRYCSDPGFRTSVDGDFRK